MRDLTREELNYSSNAAVVYEENQYTLPVLTNTHSLSLTFSSSNTNVATINSSGVVSIVGNGTTTISASFAGNSDYNAKTISYILIVDIKKYLDYEGLRTFKLKIDNLLDPITDKLAEIDTIITDNELVVSNALNDLNENKADKTATVSDVAYDGTNKKITKTINGATSDVVTVSTIKTDLNLSKSDIGLDNVVNSGDSATPISGGTTKFTTGGAYTELAKKADKISDLDGLKLKKITQAAYDALAVKDPNTLYVIVN